MRTKHILATAIASLVVATLAALSISNVESNPYYGERRALLGHSGGNSFPYPIKHPPFIGTMTKNVTGGGDSGVTSLGGNAEWPGIFQLAQWTTGAKVNNQAHIGFTSTQIWCKFIPETCFRLPATVSGPGLITLDGPLMLKSRNPLGNIIPPQVLQFTFATDETGHNYTVSGKDFFGAPLTEVVAGGPAGTKLTTLVYDTLISVTADAASTGNVSIGTLYNDYQPQLGMSLADVYAGRVFLNENHNDFNNAVGTQPIDAYNLPAFAAIKAKVDAAGGTIVFMPNYGSIIQNGNISLGAVGTAAWLSGMAQGRALKTIYPANYIDEQRVIENNPLPGYQPDITSFHYHGIGLSQTRFWDGSYGGAHLGPSGGGALNTDMLWPWVMGLENVVAYIEPGAQILIDGAQLTTARGANGLIYKCQIWGTPDTVTITSANPQGFAVDTSCNVTNAAHDGLTAAYYPLEITSTKNGISYVGKFKFFPGQETQAVVDVANVFNGYFAIGNGDSAKLTTTDVSCVIRASVGSIPATLSQYLVGSELAGLFIRVNQSTGSIAAFMNNQVPPGGTIFNYRTANGKAVPGVVFNFFFGFKGSGATGVALLYVDDSASKVGADPTGGPFALEMNQRWTISNRTRGTISEPLVAGSTLGRAWCTGNYLDWSIVANRRLFMNADKTPVNLPSDGSAGGFLPYMWIEGSAGTMSFGKNKGTSAGGRWAIGYTVDDPSGRILP